MGQPDSVLLADNQTILTVYPTGHGIGSAQMKNTTDGGLSWSERMEIPESWKTSHETPTIYALDLVNGTQWVIQISGGPGWGDGFKGWTASISKNAGHNFTEYEKFFEGEYEVIVGMASLLQVKEGD